MQALMQIIDRLNDLLARVLGWTVFAMLLASCGVVALRYLFNSGPLIFLQELVIYLHATTFMLGAAWVLKSDGHVRVDVFYRRASVRRQAWTNALGTLVLLMPLAVFLLLSSQSFVTRSWRLLEGSPEPGGIPALFLLKSLIPAMAILLLAQGLAELIRSALVLMQSPNDEDHD